MSDDWVGWWEHDPGDYLDKSVTVYEDLRLKNRPIGFIWPVQSRIILNG